MTNKHKIFLILILSAFLTQASFAEDEWDLRVKTSDFIPELNQKHSDAQYFTCPGNITLDDCKAMHKDALDTEKAKRIANHIDRVKNPPAPVEPTEAELIAMKQAIIDQKAQLDAQIAEVDMKISEKTKGDIQTK